MITHFYPSASPPIDPPSRLSGVRDVHAIATIGIKRFPVSKLASRWISVSENHRSYKFTQRHLALTSSLSLPLPSLVSSLLSPVIFSKAPVSSQSSASKNSGVSYGSANKIICIRPGNYLTNSSAYRAIKRHSRPPDADAISPLSFLFSLLLSRRCLDISWRHATAKPFPYIYVLLFTRIFSYPFNTSPHRTLLAFEHRGPV